MNNLEKENSNEEEINFPLNVVTSAVNPNLITANAGAFASEEIIRDKFWTGDHNSKIVFNQKKLTDYLEANGFGKFYLNNDNYIVIRLVEGIYSPIEPVDVKGFIIDRLKNDFRDEAALSAFYKNAETLISNSKFELLPTIECMPFVDTDKECYLFYKNNIVIVKKDSVQTIAYNLAATNSCLPESSIIKRDFNTDTSISVFETFIKNTMDNDPARIKTLMSSMGYLLHNFQDPTNTRAIIFTDEQIYRPGEANGGTGKSLATKALGHIRNMANEDGKSFKAGNNFAYQQVGYDTNIICFNDANKYFGLEDLYSILTDGLTVNKKHKQAFKTPIQLLFIIKSISEL